MSEVEAHGWKVDGIGTGDDGSKKDRNLLHLTSTLRQHQLESRGDVRWEREWWLQCLLAPPTLGRGEVRTVWRAIFLAFDLSQVEYVAPCQRYRCYLGRSWNGSSTSDKEWSSAEDSVLYRRKNRQWIILRTLAEQRHLDRRIEERRASANRPIDIPTLGWPKFPVAG